MQNRDAGVPIDRSTIAVIAGEDSLLVDRAPAGAVAGLISEAHTGMTRFRSLWKGESGETYGCNR